ncbi:hypothetical protein SKUN_0033 [Spiroplasma kunkelii CR2-3x]|uniref:Uncharacterized protein n=1 Tax=Spiroplasma kunkelii CR2-3x TaxID=273035 RepID=A0A0K2JET5_SPIKU|nr:hypothetical protein [Spiroplasma kunkelii]ALA96958.1 hypothetical protein SKUN_0033 [Spiroplasma kunkelii CR2-3x]
MIKVGIDPSGTGTTGIVVYENNKLIKKYEFTNKYWKEHYKFINNKIKETMIFINVEDCLYTNANGSKDRDDLLRLLGSLCVLYSINWWVSPRYTKSVVKNMENLSKYQQITAIYEKDNLLTYEYRKGWFYNNEKNK